MYNKQDGILSNGCNIWTLTWCHRVRKLTDKYLAKKSLEPWYSKKKN